jgi:hypothetical protein
MQSKGSEGKTLVKRNPAMQRGKYCLAIFFPMTHQSLADSDNLNCKAFTTCTGTAGIRILEKEPFSVQTI